MKHPLLLLAILGVISLTMRFTASPPSSNPATAPTSAANRQQKSTSAPPTKTVSCYLGEPQPTYTKTGPYQSSQELHEDLEHPELWVGNILAAPVWRKGKPFGIRFSFKTPSPLARLGLQNGDIV